jgi:CheY-like chemotaxis protein
VLVADDNQINQEVTVLMLEQMGCRNVRVVVNGREAIDAVSDGTFDLILMDCQMPVIDGYEATRELRRREAEHGRPRLVVIALTANASAEDRARCEAAGMDDFLSKPFQCSDLGKAMQKWSGCTTRPADDREASSLVRGVLLDPSVLQQLEAIQRPQSPDRVARLVGIFDGDSTNHLHQLRDAIERDDRRAVVRLAHALRGTSASLGATALAGVLEEIERRAGSNAEPPGPRDIDEIEALHRETVAALRRELAALQRARVAPSASSS